MVYTGSAVGTFKLSNGSNVTITTTKSNNVVTATITAAGYSGTAPISVSNYVISHATTLSAATSAGVATNNTEYIINSSNGVSIPVPRLTANTYGHVTALTANNAVVKVSVTQTLTEGTACATIAGTTIYSGTSWGTF